MINLLPPETKREFRAAHANTALIRYITFLGISMAFLAVACSVTYMFLLSAKTTNEELSKTASTIKSSQSSYQNQTDNLNVSTSILSRKITYSNIITSLGSVLPAGTILKSLTLDSSTIGSTYDIQIMARSADLEPNLKNTINGSPLFSNYKLISTETDSTNPPEYPITLNVNVVMNKAAN